MKFNVGLNHMHKKGTFKLNRKKFQEHLNLIENDTWIGECICLLKDIYTLVVSLTLMTQREQLDCTYNEQNIKRHHKSTQAH